MLNPLIKGLTREGVDRLSKGMRLWLEQAIVVVTLPRRLEIPRSRFKEIKQNH